MDQKTLRDFEARCTQEEPAACVAACPIHVDVRTFAGCVARGAWEEAWGVLLKRMPLAGILARLCHGPCQGFCTRGQVDEPIALPLLEGACACRVGPPRKVQTMPGKGVAVAVVGGALSSLTVAWDLLRKGYGVTLFEPGPRPWGTLRRICGDALPEEVLAQELGLLETMGLILETGEIFPDPLSLRERFKAVYLGLDGVEQGLVEASGGETFFRNRDGSRTHLSSHQGLFVGASALEPTSPIHRAAQGRQAATTVDRFLQGVSLTAGRDREGPFPSRLHVSVKGVTPKRRVIPGDPGMGYTTEEALEEAGRCLQCTCLQCVEICAYLEAFGGYPKRYAREIYNNDSIVMGPRQGNRLVNACMLCGRCEVICPEGFPMQDLCLEARRSLVQKGKMPPSAHEFALLDMAFSNGERFFLARHEPGRGESAQAFFPGCQWCASAPGQVARVYGYLRERVPGGVGLMLGCCGAPARWAGEEARCEAVFAQWLSAWRDLGEPGLIVACSTCFQMLRPRFPEGRMASLWEVFGRVGVPGGLAVVPAGGPLAVHDPCTTRHAPEFHESVRGLLQGLGQPFEELPLNREKTACCGFGGLVANADPPLAREAARRRAAEGDLDYVTYCAVCRDSLASVGKRAIHLADLLFPEEAGPDPAMRRRPGWSERRENRSRLKETLLRDCWGEGTRDMEAQETILLRISPEMERRLEERRILREDIQKVILHAEATKRRLTKEESGRHRASFRPHTVTFWVEYSPAGDGAFLIHNAYSHRMEIFEEGGS